MENSHITVVIPVLNEEAVIAKLVAQLTKVLNSLPLKWNVIFIDDGSTDKTLEKLKDLHESDARFKTISFSRNFGKEAAIAAGFHYAQGDAVILMDADLQHPPSVIPQFIKSWREGYKVVFAQRQSRDGDSRLRKLLSQGYYFIFRGLANTQLPPGVVDFLLLDRQAVNAINKIPEQTRFAKGLHAWIGFPSKVIPFVSEDREGGTSRWSFVRLFGFGLDGLISFSSVPLKVWSYFGALISICAIAYAFYFLIATLLFEVEIPGYPSLIVSIMFFAGAQLISLGVIGEYLARVYEEVKGRPLYLIAESIGIDSKDHARN